MTNPKEATYLFRFESITDLGEHIPIDECVIGEYNGKKADRRMMSDAAKVDVAFHERRELYIPIETKPDHSPVKEDGCFRMAEKPDIGPGAMSQ